MFMFKSCILFRLGFMFQFMFRSCALFRLGFQFMFMFRSCICILFRLGFMFMFRSCALFRLGFQFMFMFSFCICIFFRLGFWFMFRSCVMCGVWSLLMLELEVSVVFLAIVIHPKVIRFIVMYSCRSSLGMTSKVFSIFVIC